MTAEEAEEEVERGSEDDGNSEYEDNNKNARANVITRITTSRLLYAVVL